MREPPVATGYPSTSVAPWAAAYSTAAARSAFATPLRRAVRATTKQLIDQTSSPGSRGSVRERSSRGNASRGPSPTQPTAWPSRRAPSPGAGSPASVSASRCPLLTSAVVFDQFDPGLRQYWHQHHLLSDTLPSSSAAADHVARVMGTISTLRLSATAAP